MPITRMGGLVYIQTLVLNRRKFKTLGFVPCDLFVNGAKRIWNSLS